MATDSEELKRKYQDIREAYEKVWLTKRYKGILIYSNEYIFAKLGEKFYLKPKTIENILFYRRSA